MEKKLQQRRTNAVRCVVLFCMINYRKSNCFCLCTDVMGMHLLSPNAVYNLIGKQMWCLVVPAIVMSKVSKLGLSKSRVEL